MILVPDRSPLIRRVLPLLLALTSLAGAPRAEEPALRVTPDSLNFVVATGQTTGPLQAVSFWLSDRSRHWRLTYDADWLAIDRLTGDGSVGQMTARFRVNHAGLAPGRHATTVVAELDGMPETRVELPVNLRVFDLPVIRDVGGRKQLFIDQRFIEESENVVLKVNPPTKIGQTLDENGEVVNLGFIMRVLEDEGKYLIYHGGERIFLSESSDGIHWTRVPDVDIPIPYGIMLIDPRDVPERRYKLFNSFQREGTGDSFDPDSHGIYGYYSGDGRQFTRSSRLLPMWIDNVLIPWWDERIGKYVIFTRAQAAPESPEERRGGVANQRRVARIETDDILAPWPYDTTVPPSLHQDLLTNRHIGEILKTDEHDYQSSDIYYNSATIYPYAEDVYLMFTANCSHFVHGYHTQLRARPNQIWEDYGLIEIQLAVSRDGIHWTRPERVPYIDIGRPDEWDRWLLTAGTGLIRKGDDVLQFYSSSGHTHDSNIIRPEEYENAVEQKMGGTGIVRQRLDGFVSADVDHRGGFLETPPVVFSGRKLRLNIDTGAVGLAQVELRDAEGRPLPGFELSECEPILGNFTDYYVNWRGGSDVSALAGTPVKIHFKLNRAKLYGFQFTDE